MFAGAFISNLHFKVEITPPTLVIGKDIKLQQYMNDSVYRVVIPSKRGHLNLSLGLEIKGGN
jgi:CheY-specific phosphatase CheX